jgi:hypothetical protein
MAAPVVTGTVALMLQANPTLTPNAVKAILQYTAQVYPGFDALTQGAGFLNARGAVELARFLAAPSTTDAPSTAGWSRQIIWGTHRAAGGWLALEGSAWSSSVVWGDTTTSSGFDIVWGAICTGGCDGSDAVWAPWAASAAPQRGEWDDVVWGSTCGGESCPPGTVWSTSDGDTVVWGSSDGDTVVWGSSDGDTVVWGSGCIDASCQMLWNEQNER